MKTNIYLEAPNELERYSHLDQGRTIFLAGSSTGASNWQIDATKILLPHFNVFNPRRENYQAFDTKVEREQIGWEFKHLEIAGLTMFYFAPETLALITLLEYGKQLVKCKYAPWRKTYVTIHPDYKRKNDVLIQTELESPLLLTKIFYNLEEMYEVIIKENK